MHRTLLLISCLAWLPGLAPAGEGESPRPKLGFYSAMEPENDPVPGGAEGVFDLEKQADRVIWCHEEDEYDLGIDLTEGQEYTKSLRHGWLDIVSFLQKEKHKDFVVVWFGKTVHWRDGPEAYRAYIRKVVKQLQSVGYKRVAILGARGSGVDYLADTALENGVPEPEEQP